MLYARWSINTYAVTFDSDGGSAVTAQNIAHGSTATQPADPTRNGYEFDGWFNGDTKWNFATAITAPTTLKAKWTAVHIVTFDSDGGSAVVSQTIRNGNTATKPETDPSRDGYEFDGWFNGETEWNFTTAITAPITLTAKWTKMHTVTFDSDGGSAVSVQTIRNGNTATKPVDPTKTIASGLYLGNPDVNYTFDGWYNGETMWDFDDNVITAPTTFQAKWSLAGDATRIESVLSNDVASSVAYVNANSYGGEEYTLLIGVSNVTLGAQLLNAANAKLTIIGIGAERTLTSTSFTLFTIDGNNATSLTLGRNITLAIRSDYYSGEGLVVVKRGNLTMREGSKITEFRAVSVEGINAIFKMEGGEISRTAAYVSVAGVHVSAGGTFEMSGGSITSNNTQTIDLYIDYNCTFRLSGNARIGSLMLNANNATTRSSVTIVGNFSGTVTRLHLSGYLTNLSAAASTLWTNAPVVINGTVGIINMFNNGLGDFQDNFLRQTPISATHILNASGLLVLKEN